MGDDADGRRHRLDIEDEARKNKGGQKGDDDGDLPGHKLIAGDTGNQQPHAQRRQQKERRAGEQHPETTDQGDGEKPDGQCHGEQHAAHAHDKIRNQFAQQNLAHGDRSGHEGLHGAAFPLTGYHQGGQQGANEGHDHRDQTRHQIVPAAQGGIEPDAVFAVHRDDQRGSGVERALLQPVLPDALHIALQNARIVGIYPVDQNTDGGGISP
jgi:hypothetical protein